MKPIRQIPTILGLLILTLGIAAGVFLTNMGPKFLSQAKSENVPTQVKITNITDSGFTVSWITSEPIPGFIKYGTDNSLTFLAKDDRDQLAGTTGNFLTHHVTIKNLKSATTYFFKIGSGGNLYDNNGLVFQILTAPQTKTALPENDVAYGTILDQNGSPAEGVIVYLTLPNSITQSTLTKNSGSWVIPLNLALSSNLSSPASYDRESSVEEILVQGPPKLIANAINLTKNDSPTTTIALGGNFDFRETLSKIADNQEPALPESQFSLPENQDFSFSPSEISINNPSAGEKINTLKPEFIGSGPAGTTIKIEINSINPIISQTKINSNGTWNWAPSTNLAPGEHTITISLPDGKSITRRFTVLAAEASDWPAFTASPSATLTPTITGLPSSSPTPSPTVILALSPTIALTPTNAASFQPGNLTPTFLIFIMGSSLFLIGLGGKILIKET